MHENAFDQHSELRMVAAPLAVPAEHSLAGIRAVHGKYKAGGYEELIAASVGAYNNHGYSDVLLVPMVRFIMDASLTGLEQFDATELGSLQHDIFVRADVAANYAIAANRYALDVCAGLFARFYNRHPAMRAAM